MLEDGTEITPEKATAWVAGASAGATFNQSLTFVEYEGAVDVLNRLDEDQVIERLKKASFYLHLMHAINRSALKKTSTL